VTIHDEELAFPGYNLVVSGHAPEAWLMDMGGRVVHRWKREAPVEYGVQPQRNFWRRVELLESGELLAIFDPYGMLKLDRESRSIWATPSTDHIHHDLSATADGLIYTLGKRHRKIPELDDRLTFGEDLILVLDPDGRVIDRLSILEAFMRSPFGDEILDGIRAGLVHATGDAWEDFHANTIQVLDGSLERLGPAFEAGNVVSCSPHVDNVFIVDLETRSVVWNWSGPWRRIHEPQVLPTGTLVLFHNNGLEPALSSFSEVVEYDLLEREQTWIYDGRPRPNHEGFFSGTSSTVERLPNGNTLIVVTEAG